MTTNTAKKVTNAQMNWMLNKGFAWYAPSEDNWSDPIYTRTHVYYSVPPTPENLKGYYEAA